MAIAHCTLNTKQCTLNMQWRLHTAHYTLYTTHYTLKTKHCTPFTMLQTLHYVFRSIVALHSFRLKLCSVKYKVHCTQCTVFPATNTGVRLLGL